MTARKTTPPQRDANCRSSPEHARRLLAAARETHNDAQDAESSYAFLVNARSSDSLAEGLGEAFIESATSGQESATHRHDQITTEEDGGPFVITSALDEFAAGTDDSNTDDATREPFPTSSDAPAGPPQVFRGRRK
ncbi:MAG: hypothetical protein ABI895_04540 [Deltaproteobacteria bacterium]